MHLAHVAWHLEIHQGLVTEHMFQIISASRHTATSKESTQLSSQLAPCVVDPIIVEVGRPLLETEIVVVMGSALAVAVVDPVMYVLTVAMAEDVLVMRDATRKLVEMVFVIVPVPTSTPMQPEVPALHDENAAILGPTSQSSPNCPLYGLRYEEALEGKCSMPEIATMGLGFVGPALLSILISAHWT